MEVGNKMKYYTICLLYTSCDFGKSSGVFERAIKENIVEKINLKNDEKNIINIIKENRNNIENGRKISVDITESICV